ncbi:MAG TPA: sensor domain-containing diguanylate cyclase [Thermoleophilia bacterium]|nr:sensor domain-containing diguanylate cyclase [Thermoleophilia bacterium]
MPIPLVMMARLTALITHAAESPGSRPVRFSVAAFTLGQAVALMVDTRLQIATGSHWETEVLLAAALNVLISVILVAIPWRILGDRSAAAAAGLALALGTSAGTLTTGGSGGLFHPALPAAAFMAAVMFPWRRALLIGAAVVGSYFIGTFSHGGDLSFRSWYETVVALLVTLVVFAGAIGMKNFLGRNAEILGRQNEDLDDRVRELAAIISFVRSVDTTSDREFMRHQGLLMALEATACDAGILFLQAEEGVLEPHHWIGLSDEVATALCRKATLDTPPAVARWAAGESGTVVVPDMSEWSYAGDTVGPTQTLGGAEMPAGIQGSLTAVPIAIEGTTFGALVVIDSRGRVPAERGLRVLDAVAAEVALVVDRQHYVDEGEQQLRQLETLHKIARRVTGSLKTGEVLEFAVGETPALVDADVAYIATLTGTERRLRIVAQHGLVSDGLLGLEIEEGHGIGGQVVAERAIFHTEDYCADPRLEHAFGDMIDAEGLRTIIGLPLTNHDRVLGVLYAARHRVQTFRAPEIAVLEMLASQIAVALYNARLYEDVRHESIHDSLTGIFNRRLFERRLREEERRAARHGRPLSLLMIDADDFKRRNDTHGHSKGDELLKALVATMADAIRTTDVLARYGGEEFAVILPETDLPEAIQTGERIRQAVKDRFAVEGGAADPKMGSGTITVSVGAAAFDEKYAGGPSLLERADAAMYEAKRQSKDRVVADDTAALTSPEADAEWATG